jgi:hypothetical protein
MADDVEETALAAGFSYSSRDFAARFCSIYQRAYVDNRNR